MKYNFEFENTKNEDDTTYDVEGITFYVDKASLQHLNGSTIDYVETLQESGFKVTNPGAASGCGCGKSFS